MNNKIAWQKKYAESQKDIIRKCIALGLLAPSTHNCQPWLFDVISSKKVDVYLNDGINLENSDRNYFYRLVSIGALLENMAVAAESYGYGYKIKYFDDFKNSPVATFSLEFKKTAANTKNIKAIYNRYSEKRINDSQKPLPNKYLKYIDYSDKYVSIYKTNNVDKIKNVAYDFYQSALSYSNNTKFAKELSDWMRTDNSKSYNGMPAASSGLSNMQLLVGSNILRLTPKILKPMSKKYLKLVGSSSAVGFIASKNYSTESLLRCGRAFEAIALKFAELDYSVTALAAIVDNEEYNEKLQQNFDAKQKPVIFFRIAPAQKNHFKTPRFDYEKLIYKRPMT